LGVDLLQFGRFEDVVNDCCGHCPVPKTEDEKAVAENEEKLFVSGRISFMRDDPGRQVCNSIRSSDLRPRLQLTPVIANWLIQSPN
jgi:hypothetical protein